MFASVHVAGSRRSRSLSGDQFSKDFLSLARYFSPRLEMVDARTVVLDVTGLRGMWGSPRAFGAAVQRKAIEQGIHCRVALAATRIAAVLSAYGRTDVLTVIKPGREATAIATLPLDILARVANFGLQGNAATPVEVRNRNVSRMIKIFQRWGLATLGDLAALPRDALFSRFGTEGVMWQKCACGEESQPLVPTPENRLFEVALDLEWPVEGFEPLASGLRPMLESLVLQLSREGAAAAVLTVRLWLVTRVWYTRTLQLPAPICDSRMLCTLLVLDLKSHPPPAGIDRVVVTVIPAPTRITQFSLFEKAIPSIEQLSTLLARLKILMGSERCGTPVLSETHHPNAFDVGPFDPTMSSAIHLEVAEQTGPIAISRRFHLPLVAQVTVDCGCPVLVSASGGIGRRSVERCAGPWRSSGHWWEQTQSVDQELSTGYWSRDEWDVELDDGSVYCIYRDRTHGEWFVAGFLD